MMDREEIARIEVGHTNVSAGVARGLVVGFLGFVALLPIVEFAGARAGETGGPWRHLLQLPSAIDDRLAAATTAAPLSRWRTIVTANRALLSGLVAFESALEDQSAVGELLRPPTQALLTAWTGAGNERVYVGRDGWLFYRPDVESVTGRGFLDPSHHERRLGAAAEYQEPPSPDPRPAIIAFDRMLETRGVTLIVMPTPVKPTIHPDQLAGRLSGSGPIQNPSYGALLTDLATAGVLVFDPTTVIADTTGYLATDTHWRPDAMERVADALAMFVREHANLSTVPSSGYRAERREARNSGDTVAMLDLPAGQTLYAPERVSLRYVVDANGDQWRASRDADVLVLGDSFSNIFSLPSMGWGEAAGFVEQLSYALQRPIDRIVQNDDGAHATREMLAREVATGSDRLAGKRVVIWQFAARELVFGDWRLAH
jgi:hypothetical protein